MPGFTVLKSGVFLFFLSLFQVLIVECFVFYVRENLPNGSMYVKFLGVEELESRVDKLLTK